MFKINSSVITSYTLSHYSVTNHFESPCIAQDIYWDKPDEFGATLNVLGTAQDLKSLNFMYHPKNAQGSTLLLSIFAVDNGFIIHFSNNNKITKSYKLEKCQELSAALIKHIINVNSYRTLADKYLESGPLMDIAKNLLQKFASITRTLINSDSHTDYALIMISKLFETEATKFKDIYELELSLSQCAQANFLA